MIPVQFRCYINKITYLNEDIMKLLPLGFILLSLSFTVLCGSTPEKEAAPHNAPARIDTVRLKPSQHPDLPADIARWLEKEGYNYIPQALVPRPNNVITGRFLSPDSTDLAVFATKNGENHILVFPSGRLENIQHVYSEDEFYYSLWKRNSFGYYKRYINTGKRDFIQYWYDLINKEELALEEYVNKDNLNALIKLKTEAIMLGLVDSGFDLYFYHNGIWEIIEISD